MERAITSGQQVLLPESTKSKRKQRSVTVAVNSRDRNIGQDYLPNSFRWSFRRPLKDVLSIELVNGSVPAAMYNINTGWNQFTFGEQGNTIWTVALTPGQYTAAQMCTELQTQLNALSGKLNTYTVTYNAITMYASITATGPAAFTLYFLTSPYADIIDTHTGATMSINCPARLFGFEWQDYTSVAGRISPQHRMDPDIFLKKMYLYINADNSVELNRVEMGAGRKDCFHVLYMDQITNGYYTLNKDLHTPIFYSSPAPISRIGTLQISIRDEFYRLVDLGWQDFTLLFEITYLE
jgi:hypothetical protein